MSHALVAVILIGHGLITSMIGFVAVTSPNAPAMALPSWFGWWPGPFGRSWLFEALSFGTAASVIGGFIWLVGGLLIIAGGLGWFGFGPFEGSRVPLLVAGAAVSLLALTVYFHPIYLVAVAINIAIVFLLWGDATAAWR
ncbi:MAG TPA: hypothetical protein VHQ42_00435 [Candidatus Limnocylindria bacterium]|nr:hypothetical protein [Candidatus Limnocylindria bacterium]